MRLVSLFILSILLIGENGLLSAQEWLQWGGSDGSFKIESAKLNENWPTAGPVQKWRRPLGEGYSAILYKDGKLMTMTSEGDEEIVLQLDAKTGRTIWEHRYKRTLWSDKRKQFGAGPNATPCLFGERIITVGISGELRCLNFRTGKLLWKRNLPKEFGRRRRMEEYGYSASPLRCGQSVIVQVGGTKHAVIAVDPLTGKDIWKSPAGGVSYAQASILVLAGKKQYIYFSPEGINGLNPETGELLWHFTIPVDNGNHLTPVVQCDKNHLFVSSQFDSGGGRLLKIESAGNQMIVRQLWFDSSLQTSCWTNFRIGKTIYGSAGGHNYSDLIAFDWKTGNILWKQRGHRMAQSLYADSKLLFLDEKGNLGLAEISPDKINILQTARVTSQVSWTVPTLIGSTCYIRDRKEMVALDLGAH